jgi:hypothetical protein
MKYLNIIGYFPVLLLGAQLVSAQKISQEKIVLPRQIAIEKPSLFRNFPEKLIVSRLQLDQVFTARSSRIVLPAAEGFAFEGTVLEKVQRNPNVVSMNIRLHNYDSSLLNISRITHSDLTVTYQARVINQKSGDILLLKNENGQLYFSREKQSLVMVE